MRALSLTQPWAWLVVHGGKDIENRTWKKPFRGEFLIHASKGMREADYDDAFASAMVIGGLDLVGRLPAPEQLERGGIVGVAELYDVLDKTTRPHVPWHAWDRFGFRLRNVRPLPFLPCKGALGFWGNFEIRDGKAVQL